MEPTAISISTVLESIGQVFESAIGWAGTVANTVAAHPLLMIGFCVGLVGLGVGLFRRLSNV